MSEALLFTLIFGGLFVLRIILATVFFALILPAGDRCPNCDAATIRVESVLFERLMPWFRRSWCLRCGWEGVLLRGTVTAEAVRPASLTRR
jgi:hypothetical protein